MSAPLRRSLARLRSAARDLVPLATFRVLRVLARVLPRRGGLAAASLVGWVWYLSPPGRRRRDALRRAFPDGPGDPGRLARSSLTGPYRDYLLFRRALLGRPDGTLDPERIRSEMGTATAELLASDRPFVLATGHFSREATQVLYSPTVVNRRVLAVVARSPERPANAAEARTAEHFGQMLRRIEQLGIDRLVTIGSARAVMELVRDLRSPGTVAVLAADATISDIMPVALRRPFAGLASRPFADGAAQIARLAQVPVVVAVAFLADDGTTVVEWSDPIGPADRSERGADREITERILDRLEVAVGRRPDQYVIDVGDQRRWDPDGERWISPTR